MGRLRQANDKGPGLEEWLFRSGVLALAALIPTTFTDVVLGFSEDLSAMGAVLVFTLLGAAASMVAWLQSPILVGVMHVARVMTPGVLADLALSMAIIVPMVAILGALWSDALMRVTVSSVRFWLMTAGLVFVAGTAVKVAWAVRNALHRLLPAWGPRGAWGFVAVLTGGVLAFVWALGGVFGLFVPSALWIVTAATFVASEVLFVALGAASGLWNAWVGKVRGLAAVWLAWPVVSLAGSQLITSLSPEVGLEVRSGHAASSRVLRLLQRATDRDGDGFSAWLGGGDCDDTSASIHPQAHDAPGDGVDGDCDGADATVSDTGTFDVSSPFALAPDAGRRLNIVMICMDAVRADHVSYTGYPRKTTPNLDRFAARSWYFEQVVAPSATTRETIPALFTGRYPSGILWDRSLPIWQVLGAQRLLTEVLQQRGYRTIAIVDEWLDHFLPSFKRGFEHFEVPYGSGRWTEYGQVAAPFITYAAIREVERTPSTRPFFLYAQFEAAHHPYVVHPGFPTFGGSEKDRYDGEIAYADHYVGVLLEYLEYTGRLDQTMVIIFADHGEEFGEHGGYQHSHALHVESVWVPLVIYVPGTSPARVRERVSLVDVVPTILDVLGLRPEGMVFQGYSLLFYTKPEAVPPTGRDIFAELMVIHQGPPRFHKAIYSGDYKLLWDMDQDKTLLYSIRDDPQEKQPLHDPSVQNRLLTRLRAFVVRGMHRPAEW